ncbi:hypothetical protein D3I60_00905 [Brevibacterium permense]|uniref:arsenate reductase/protein-tyrosine-phosphatase family protein n=1 Tax=Brevibacterium permense TaxID=234834 RepID=UPI0021D0F1F3|nr:hypothetical protein [Brevibacterium permense]MCU4295654.1 hypothetical protein [Brevibacterium permense]
MTEREKSGDWAVMPAGFRILVVGATDTCRSPLAARILQREFDDRAPGEFTVSTAGAQAVAGRPVAVEVLELAARRNIRLHGCVAKELDEAAINGADLILVMDRPLRREVVKLVPHVLRITFTLREFARIVPAIRPEQLASPAGRWQSLVALAPRYRTAPRGDGSDDDVVDPLHRSLRAFDRMGSQIDQAVEAIGAWDVREFVPEDRR